jgi:flagellar protein FliO/FliZ
MRPFTLHLLIAGLLCPLLAGAEAEQHTPSPLGAGALIQSAGGLLLILALIFGLAWLLRRFGRLPQAGKGMVSVVGGVSLGPRERAVILQVGDTRLLVGVAPGRVQTLHVLEPVEAEAEQTTAESFYGRLKMAMRREQQ